jgi:hypothetical protein
VPRFAHAEGALEPRRDAPRGPGNSRGCTVYAFIKDARNHRHPLYTYIAETHPGQTTYVNILQFGGRWPALNVSGQEVK